MAGVECSPKIFDFRANGIPTGESVDFFDTLKPAVKAGFKMFIVRRNKNAEQPPDGNVTLVNNNLLEYVYHRAYINAETGAV